MGLTRGSPTRGSLTLPRMNAHRLVIIAAALTTAVAAALATALAAFSGQALPRAVHHDLTSAGGTALVITGNVNASQGAQYTSQLPGLISAALAGTPFTFDHAYWSDSLGFVAGSRPASTAPPPGAGNVQIAEAAALSGLTAQAVLVSGHWPGAPAAGQPNGIIPAALPATAAALLHVTDGDVLRMRDKLSGRLVRFAVTGLYRPRQVSSQYWGLNEIALSGSSTVGTFTTYGPLAVQASAFAGPLTVNGGSWLARPAMASIPPGDLRTVAANVGGLREALAECPAAARPDAQHEPALGPERDREQPGRGPLAAGHLRGAAVPARRRGPARGGAAARGPARGRVGDAFGPRRHPRAADPADRGRGRPAVPALLGGRRRGRRPARRAAPRDRSGRGLGGDGGRRRGRRRGDRGHGGARAQHRDPGHGPGPPRPGRPLSPA